MAVQASEGGVKLAEAVAKFIESQGITHVFGVNGGANLHLIHGLADVTKVRFIPTTHECNAGFAADAYARIRGIGCCMATSGPGATNLITAIATSYYDSVPVLYITGNCTTNRQGAKFGVRQYGFQETPIVEMVHGITKACTQLDDPDWVIGELEQLIATAVDGRKGPVLLDIPDDLQRADISYPER